MIAAIAGLLSDELHQLVNFYFLKKFQSFPLCFLTDFPLRHVHLFLQHLVTLVGFHQPKEMVAGDGTRIHPME